MHVTAHEKREPQGRGRGRGGHGHGASSGVGDAVDTPKTPHPPAQAPRNHAPPAHYSVPEPYTRYLKNMEGETAHENNPKTYQASGKDMIAKMNAPHDINVHFSGPLIEFNKLAKNKARNEQVKLEPREIYQATASQIGLDLNKNWRHDEWVTTMAESKLSETYFYTESKTLVSAVADNRDLKGEMVHKGDDGEDPAIFTNEEADEGLPWHSTIWTDTYGDGMKANGVKYVVRSQIINEDTGDIIQQARELLRPDARDTEVVTLEIDSGNRAEKDAFEALAGTDNGRTVFRMVTDYWNLLKRGKF